MKLRALSALVLGATMVLAAAPASAQAADEVMGLRFEAAFFQDFAVERGGIRPQGDLRIGYDLPMGLTPMIGIGFRSNTAKGYDADDNLNSSISTTDLVLGAQVRYYFRPHIKGLSPYVFGDFNTTIVSHGEEDGDGNTSKAQENQDKAFGDARTFLQLGAGLGLEYKFARSFGIGAQWGLGLALRDTSIHGEGADRAGANTSNTVVGTSNSIYAAFRF